MKPFRLAAALLCLSLPHIMAADFTIMSFNVWKQGSQVEDGFNKEISAIREAKADIVCLQESTPEHARKVAEALGWQQAGPGSGTAQIVTRHKVVDAFQTLRCAAARILVSDQPRQEIVVFNCHLDHRFYGPYAAEAAGATAESVLAEETRSDREEQMVNILAAMKSHLRKSGESPVFLTGDFNCPSHLDWTAATSASHGNVGAVEWPVSKRILAAGLTDAFRTRHPDPLKEPGNTWSSIHKAPEPQDRIDFIHHAGKSLKLVDCRMFATEVKHTVGRWTDAPLAEVATNTWPSDHFSVVATYTIAP